MPDDRKRTTTGPERNTPCRECGKPKPEGAWCDCPAAQEAYAIQSGGQALWHRYIADYPESSLTYSECFTMAKIVLEGAGKIQRGSVIA